MAHPPIDVVIYREGDYWVATGLNLTISSFGSTVEEARDAIQEAIELYFEDEFHEVPVESAEPQFVQIPCPSSTPAATY